MPKEHTLFLNSGMATPTCVDLIRYMPIPARIVLLTLSGPFGVLLYAAPSVIQDLPNFVILLENGQILIIDDSPILRRGDRPRSRGIPHHPGMDSAVAVRIFRCSSGCFRRCRRACASAGRRSRGAAGGVEGACNVWVGVSAQRGRAS